MLVLAGLGAALHSDLERLGWTLVPLGDGYARVKGAPYPTLVVDVDDVAAAEQDDLLGAFGHRTIQTIQANHWWQEHLVMPTNPTDMSKLEGYDEMQRKFLDSLAPEQRLAGLTPEQRLAGLTPEQLIARLTPEQLLAALTEEQIAAMPAELRAALRRHKGD